MKRIKITDEQFIEIVKNSRSITVVIQSMGLIPAGGNYFTVKARIKRLGLDTSHMTGRGWLKGKTHNFGVKIPLTDALIENSTYTNSNRLRIRLIKNKLLEPKCYNCELTIWMGKPIPLELEHKNGCKSDNRIENLTLLCPNCHAQTDTYRGKNIGKNTAM